jgi:hypothetical protein
MTGAISDQWLSGWWAAKLATTSLPLVHHPISQLNDIHTFCLRSFVSTLSFGETDIQHPAVRNVNPSLSSISALVLHFFRIMVSINLNTKL